MNITGIIAEYNPMHAGHAYQIEAAREINQSEGVILIMSGNFVQRGEPAIISKRHRAEAALRSGADLVIELPTLFATSSAESFADMSVRLLAATGVVTHLNFGSESGEITPLKAIADLLSHEPIGYKILLHEALAQGISFPKARVQALRQYAKNHHLLDSSSLDLLATPNNILGIEYIKAMNRHACTFKATTVKRIGAGYHDEDPSQKLPSATAIRKHYRTHQDLTTFINKMPPASYDIIEKLSVDGLGPLFMEDAYPLLKYNLLLTPASNLEQVLDMTEGLENRIKKFVKTSETYEDLITSIQTKRYPRTKISRALLHSFLGITKEDHIQLSQDFEPYLRILGFNAKGQQILRDMKKKNENLPFIVNVKDSYSRLSLLQQRCFDIDLRATDLYNHLLYTKYGKTLSCDYITPVLRI